MFATVKLAKVAVISNLNLSILSLILAALFIYNGNKQVPEKAVSNALFGIIAFIGKLI